MKTLVIYAHPWKESFNSKVLKRVEETLIETNVDYRIIDLIADDFDPVLKERDLALFSKGIHQDPLAEDYAKALKEAKRLIFIFPIWWYGPPAIIKGFFDKVFLKNHVYKQENRGKMEGILEIDQTIFLTSANMSKEDFIKLGDPIQNVYVDGLMGLVGSKENVWLPCNAVHDETARLQYMQDVADIIKNKNTNI